MALTVAVDRPYLPAMARTLPVVFVVVAVCVLSAFAGWRERADRYQALAVEAARVGAQVVDMPAQDFELRTLDGRSVRLSSLRGQVVFLNFWATWCPPCREELPALEALAKTLRVRPVVMLAVSQDERWEDLQRFFGGEGSALTVALDPSGGLAHHYGTEKLPETYVIGRRGRILSRFVNAQPWSSAQIGDYLDRVIASGL